MEYCFDAIVVGTGAAGYNAANRIREGGKSVAIVTEGICCGTSRNTGSDKQTYYKLGLGGDSPDSVHRMAQDLFSCGSMDGDNALCEAALSVRCFMNLCELGVPFPVNRYGEYVGYKTDHDPYARATSAGPLTSKFMTEALEGKAKALQIPVFDGLLVVEVLKDDDGVCGLLCLEKNSGEYRVFRSGNVILATGGPGGIYGDSVYPECHTGATGLALTAGASVQNMTEWQYGLASVAPRWNVSGTYMQVLPRFVSVDGEGIEREFLLEFFSDPMEALSCVFLKGYQWPFDSRKVGKGSSVIDLLVYRECVLRRRKVYLDFTRNPFGMEEIPFKALSEEAYTYLRKADGCFGTPIARLKRMNQPAIELYRSKGVDIEKEYLQIALCAQHHNGGIAVDHWWQTDIAGLFAAGECAGTHGVTRPGGSALNAGQVGSLRAAQYICAKGRAVPEEDKFDEAVAKAMAFHEQLRKQWKTGQVSADAHLTTARRRMSDCGGAIRNSEKIGDALLQIRQELQQSDICAVSPEDITQAYQLRNVLITQYAVLAAMKDFAQTVGATRGSALYTAADGDLREGLGELFRFRTATSDVDGMIQQLRMTENGCDMIWRPVRPLPLEDEAFESVWRKYRENKNVD